MTALLDRVPADLRGLIRPGSPLFDCGHRCVCRMVSVGPTEQLFAVQTDASDRMDHRLDALMLDLTTPIGRADAEAWLRRRRRVDLHLSQDESDIIAFARRGFSMTPKQIDTLARLVYRAAGRLP